jgi:trimeric autotransporter adhesin
MKSGYQLRATILVCAATFSASALLVACGGGSSTAASVIPTTPTTVNVIDGPIQGAVVFLDKNSNGVWDTGEVKGTTDSTGKVVLDVPTADIGKYPIVAIVGAGSIDADTGVAHTAAEAYTLKAPADATGVISPLTTMVQHAIESDTTKGTTTAAASAKLLQTPESPIQWLTLLHQQQQTH